MTQTDTSSEALAGAAHVDAADGEGAVSSPSIPLSELNSLLGKDFKDTATALKSLKDTQAFVGQRREDIAAEVKAGLPAQNDSDLKTEFKALKQDLFYSNNPEYKDYRDVIAKMGDNPAEVVGSDTFKGFFEKVKAADETAQSRSIVPSSNKLASVPSVREEAVRLANTPGTSPETVAAHFAKAINEALAG